MRNLARGTLLTLALLLATNCAPPPQFIVKPAPTSIEWCAKLGPYLKPASATVIEYPDGTEVLTVRCYID